MSDTSETVCRACRSLIAAVPVPFFRGADDWRHPNAVQHEMSAPAHSHSDLASQFDDPVFDLGGDVPHTEGPSEFAVPDTFESPREAAVPDTSAAQREAAVPDTSAAPREAAVPDTSVPSTAQPIVQAALAPGWRRLAAGAVDALPLGGALMLMLLFFERDLDAGGAPMIPSNLHELAQIFISLGGHAWVILAAVCAVSVIYHSFSIAYMRATVGDLLFGIRWLTLTGEPPRLGRAVTRAVLQVPSWLIAMFGVWFVFLNRTRRTLYDVVSGCYPVLRSS